jgi:hypothetical protein
LKAEAKRKRSNKRKVQQRRKEQGRIKVQQRRKEQNVNKYQRPPYPNKLSKRGARKLGVPTTLVKMIKSN